MQTVSSMTITAAVPSSEPAAITPSKSSGVSRCSPVSIGVDEPPGVHALRVWPSRTPPAISSSSPKVVPSGTSNWPGLFTWPETLKIFGPGDFSVPIERNQSAPPLTMNGTLAMVSTLLTTVGDWYSPCVAGKGGRSRGWPR